MSMFSDDGPAQFTPEPEKVEIDTSVDQKGFDTDVEGCRSDDVVKTGNIEFPVFDVDDNTFMTNMKKDRKRIRFKNGSSAQKYMSKTKYNRKFYIQTRDKNGNVNLRRQVK